MPRNPSEDEGGPLGAGLQEPASNHIKFEKLKSTSVKGKNEKVQPYKFVSKRESPLTHQLSDIKADLMGRNDELLQLNEGLEQLLSGKGNVSLIYGDAGTGKSRLVEEFKLILDQTQIQCYEGHAYPFMALFQLE